MTPPAVTPPLLTRTRVISAWQRCLFAPVKFFVGMAMCQSFFGSILIVGWAQRFAQRTILLAWWRHNRASQPFPSFSAFAAADSRFLQHVSWPNWIVAPGLKLRRDAEGRWSWFARVGRGLFASLMTNLKLGLLGACSVWILTLPGLVLMLFGWYDGWNNSFYKGYEQAWVGPVVSFLGIALLLGAMMYVPLALARQASTGDWRSFFQFRLVWKLARLRCIACAGLSGLYALVSLPLLVLVVAAANSKVADKLSGRPPREIAAYLNAYFFWAAAYVFPAYIFLRWAGARIYASAIQKGIQLGAIFEEELSELEWHALHQLDGLKVRISPPRHPVLRIAAWAGTRTGRVTAGTVAGLFWFAVIAQVYIQAFFHYRGWLGWLNQPLLQLPWFHTLPVAIHNNGLEILATAILLAGALGFFRVCRWMGRVAKG